MADEEDLLIDKLASGDRPSIFAAGIVVARALKEQGCAVLMVDVLGRVHLLPKESVEVKRAPRLRDEELQALSEEEAIQLLLKQGDSEEAIIAYLKRRDATRGL